MNITGYCLKHLIYVLTFCQLHICRLLRSFSGYFHAMLLKSCTFKVMTCWNHDSILVMNFKGVTFKISRLSSLDFHFSVMNFSGHTGQKNQNWCQLVCCLDGVELLKEIDALAADYLNNVRTLSGEAKREQLARIQRLFNKSKEFGDDKVSLAMQTYEMVRLISALINYTLI